METKIKLILDMLNESTLDKTMKDHEDMINDYKSDGFGDMHTNNIESYKTGLHYTHGYCVGHTELLKSINNLLNMTEDELVELKKENKRIEAENKKHFDEILNKIKNDYKDKTK